MKNGSDNWLFLDSFMSLDQSHSICIFQAKNLWITRTKEKLYNYDVVCGGQKSKKPIQREIAPRRPPRKKEKLEDF